MAEAQKATIWHFEDKKIHIPTELKPALSQYPGGSGCCLCYCRLCFIP